MAEEKDKPGLADIVIESGKKGDDGSETDPEESTEDFDSAASELFDAVKAGDESAFKESLRACVMALQ